MSARFAPFICLTLGLVCLSLCAFAQMDSLKKVLDTLSQEDERYVKTLWKAMNATIQTNNPQAAAYAREAYRASVNFPPLVAEATVNFAERLVFIEQLDSADQLLGAYYQSFVVNQSDSTHLTKYYLTRGAIESRRAHLKEAGDYYTAAIKLADQRGDLKTAGTALLRIGSMYHREGDFKSALGYYLQAIEYFRSIKNESGLASTYSNISSVYANLEDYTHADLYLDSSLMIEERQDKVDALIASYGNVVINAVEKRKDLHRALIFWEKLQKVSARSNTPRLKGYTHNVNAVYYIGKGEYQQAYSAAMEAYKIGKEHKIRFVLSIAYQNLVKATQRLNNFERAFFYQQEWNAFKDSINIAEQENALLELKTRYETENKEAENKRLLQVNQQQEIVNKLLGGGGILLLLMLGSLFYFYKGKQRANQKLEAHKRQIELNLREKESLLREIHHRVKNNLQVISSLLNMQSYHVQDQDMMRALAEGQSRVKAMALIHQKLYQTEQLSEIDFQDYTEQLVTHLNTAFGQQDKKIKTLVNGSNIKLDIDTAIPLGLILNELITNAYKYAFNNQAEGKLMVELKQDETYYQLTVMDNGHGLPVDFNEANLTSLGLKLVRMLIEQLDGSLTIESANGTLFKILFKETRVSA
jgi:two-component sensor histidine kinase